LVINGEIQYLLKRETFRAWSDVKLIHWEEVGHALLKLDTDGLPSGGKCLLLMGETNLMIPG